MANDKKTPGFVFKSHFPWYQEVYMVLDPKQETWIITGVQLDPNGPAYVISRPGHEDLVAFEGELSTVPNELLRLGAKAGDDDED